MGARRRKESRKNEENGEDMTDGNGLIPFHFLIQMKKMFAWDAVPSVVQGNWLLGSLT